MSYKRSAHSKNIRDILKVFQLRKQKMRGRLSKYRPAYTTSGSRLRPGIVSKSLLVEKKPRSGKKYTKK